jgi:DNA (cytosine-5)-methyltransferase 1
LYGGINAAIVSKIDPESSGMEHKQHDRKQFRRPSSSGLDCRGPPLPANWVSRSATLIATSREAFRRQSWCESEWLKSQRKSTARAPARFRFIDLFAGIGGLRIGFEAIGGQCVFTSEWDRWSNATYRQNFPDGEDHVMVGDIRPYGAEPSLIPEFDVLLAGFPCQPFSLAGVSKKNSLGRARLRR